MSPDQRLCPPVSPSGDSAPLDLGETQTLAKRDSGESVFYSCLCPFSCETGAGGLASMPQFPHLENGDKIIFSP